MFDEEVAHRIVETDETGEKSNALVMDSPKSRDLLQRQNGVEVMVQTPSVGHTHCVVGIRY